MTEASLFRKNLIFLDAAQPGVASLVRRSTDTITRAVPGAGGRAVDIDIGAGRLYNQDAFAEAQVAAWRGAPMRVVAGRPEPEDLHDPGTKCLSAALSDAAGDARGRARARRAEDGRWPVRGDRLLLGPGAGVFPRRQARRDGTLVPRDPHARTGGLGRGAL
jgi:hypothetical protein